MTTPTTTTTTTTTNAIGLVNLPDEILMLHSSLTEIEPLLAMIENLTQAQVCSEPLPGISKICCFVDAMEENGAYVLASSDEPCIAGFQTSINQALIQVIESASLRFGNNKELQVFFNPPRPHGISLENVKVLFQTEAYSRIPSLVSGPPFITAFSMANEEKQIPKETILYLLICERLEALFAVRNDMYLTQLAESARSLTPQKFSSVWRQVIAAMEESDNQEPLDALIAYLKPQSSGSTGGAAGTTNLISPVLAYEMNTLTVEQCNSLLSYLEAFKAANAEDSSSDNQS